MESRRKRLGDLLIEEGLLTETQVSDALKLKRDDQKLGNFLVEQRFISEQQLIEALEIQLRIKQVSLYSYPIDPTLMTIVQKDFATHHQLIPLQQKGNKLLVAMVDPMDYFAIDDLRMLTGLHIETVIATTAEVTEAIGRYYTVDDALIDEGLSEQEIEAIARTDEGLIEDEAPVIKLVNHILETGIRNKASDIHIDPSENTFTVRYRIDGLLKTERMYPKNLQNAFIARIKIMANLNITETRLPQDGRIKTAINNTSIDLRIAILPTVNGEKVVIRILDLGNKIKDLSKLGFNKLNYSRFMEMIKQPSGLILITGPTGSGKSSTIYAALNHLNTDKVNIITIEDPVEYEIEGMNQVQVNSQVGLTFARGLRSILRQDPNIIMVGEIRDTDTAEIAIRASLTGHLVLSTLHTNSAIATIPRLIDMGIEPYLVVSALSAIVAQRLVRKNCQECIKEHEPTPMEESLFKKRGITPGKVFRGSGCRVCQDTGYKGRMAIQEVLLFNEEIKQMMMNNQSMASIHDYALEEGMIFLIDDGLLKVKQGLTTMEEVLRVASDE